MGIKTDRLEEVRQVLQLNKTQFAEAMGIKPHYYYHILGGKGNANLRIEHLESLFTKHSVNPAWILTGIGERFLEMKGGVSLLAGDDIIPEPANVDAINQDDVHYLMGKIFTEINLPILTSDLAFFVCERYCKYYIGKYPDATRESLDIPALTAGFLALLQTLQSLVNAAFQLQSEDIVQVRFGQQKYNFVRQVQPGK